MLEASVIQLAGAFCNGSWMQWWWFIIKFQMISLELYFCPNGLSRSIQVWIKINSHGKILKKLETIFTVCCPEWWFAFQTCIWNSVYLNLNWRMTEKYSVLTTAGREEMRWSWTFASASESTSFRNGYALLYMADVFFSIFSIFLQFIFHLQRKENFCYILCQIISCKLFSIDVRW